ncbi:MAG: hypothetical protein Q4B68_10005 [Bacteroidales bacterium]|nr:hypothetical protein [Bacteroidales bacterium]
METYKSDKHVIECDIATVYGKLSDPEVFRRHLDANIDKLPEEARQHLQNLKFEDGGVVIESPMGPLKLGIVEKVEPSKIVFGAAQSPVPFGLSIDLKEVDADHTESVTSLQLDLPIMLRAMVGGKLKDGAKKFGEMIARLPYKEL